MATQKRPQWRFTKNLMLNLGKTYEKVRVRKILREEYNFQFLTKTFDRQTYALLKKNRLWTISNIHAFIF